MEDGKCRLDTGMHFHCHRCRHTVGTRLLQRGISIDKVQDVLGHENISTTRHYARTAPEAVLEIARMGFISADQVVKLAEPLKKNGCGQYLLNLIMGGKPV